jgi:hypothetical protein
MRPSARERERDVAHLRGAERHAPHAPAFDRPVLGEGQSGRQRRRASGRRPAAEEGLRRPLWLPRCDARLRTAAQRCLRGDVLEQGHSGGQRGREGRGPVGRLRTPSSLPGSLLGGLLPRRARPRGVEFEHTLRTRGSDDSAETRPGPGTRLLLAERRRPELPREAQRVSPLESVLVEPCVERREGGRASEPALPDGLGAWGQRRRTGTEGLAGRCVQRGTAACMSARQCNASPWRISGMSG